MFKTAVWVFFCAVATSCGVARAEPVEIVSQASIRQKLESIKSERHAISVFVLVGDWCACLKLKLRPNIARMNFDKAAHALGQSIHIIASVLPQEEFNEYSKELGGGEGSPQGFVFIDGVEDPSLKFAGAQQILNYLDRLEAGGESHL